MLLVNPGLNARARKIVGPFNPTREGAQAAYWREHFCWPVGIVDSRGAALSSEFMRRYNLVEPVLGVVAPAYRPKSTRSPSWTWTCSSPSTTSTDTASGTPC